MALLAVAKFKAGGQRNHDQWLLEKEAERRAEYVHRTHYPHYPTSI